MGAGMLGGLAFGILSGYALPASFNVRESALLAVAGLLLGWTVAWFFARTIPRDAH
jgi:hypothetical protein